MAHDLSRLKRSLGYLEKSIQTKKVQKEVTPPSFLKAWTRKGTYTYHRTVALENRKSADISRQLVSDVCDTGDFLFYDTETTGLSTGAGTIIFLIGLASISGPSIIFEQFFLTDFPGEEEFLRTVQPGINQDKLFISYNGKCFDSHMLKNRFLLNGMDLEFKRQLDLLYWSRRLWKKSLSSCTLANIEKEILGKHRVSDVPGYEVPGIYFNYLRTGRPVRMQEVIDHNFQDVLSLIDLFSVINGILKLKDIPDQTDLSALGGWLLDRNDSTGLDILKKAFTRGSRQAGRIMSLYYKRQGRWNEAVKLWQEMYGRSKGLFAGVELAKYYEHRKRNPERALSFVREMLIPPLDKKLRKEVRLELIKRKLRLQKKISRHIKTDT